MQEYLDMWRGYVDFNGRTTVKGYWIAILVNFLVASVIGIIGGILGTTILSTAYSLAVFIPTLAIIVRRFRDSGRNPLWIFISLVPCVGWIMMIIFLCKPSVD